MSLFQHSEYSMSAGWELGVTSHVAERKRKCPEGDKKHKATMCTMGSSQDGMNGHLTGISSKRSQAVSNKEKLKKKVWIARGKQKQLNCGDGE